MHSSLIPQNYSISDLIDALNRTLQGRMVAVRTKRKVSPHSIFCHRNFLFLQYLLKALDCVESSYFYTFTSDHKGSDISDFSHAGGRALWMGLNTLSMFLPFWPRLEYLKRDDKMFPLSHQPVDIYGFLTALPNVGGIFMGYKSDILASQDDLSPLMSD